MQLLVRAIDNLIYMYAQNTILIRHLFVQIIVHTALRKLRTNFSHN